jgi:hypothetical protein
MSYGLSMNLATKKCFRPGRLPYIFRQMLLEPQSGPRAHGSPDPARRWQSFCQRRCAGGTRIDDADHSEASGGQKQRSTPDLPVSEELTDEDEDLLGLQGGQDPFTSFRRMPGERAGPPYLRR